MSCLDLQSFRSLESGDVHQNFWSSESLAPGLQNLQVLRSWRRSSELQVFRIFGTWSSESSSPQKLETFIRTSGLQNLWHLIRNATSEAGTVHQNFLSRNLQLGFWANDQSLQKLTCIRIRNSVFF